MEFLVLIPLLPLLAFLVTGLLGKWIGARAHWVAVPAVAVSWLLSVVAFFQLASDGEPLRVTLYEWISSGALRVNIALYVDQLTAVMLLLVTTVSTLVHVYTIGYKSWWDVPTYLSFSSWTPDDARTKLVNG